MPFQLHPWECALQRNKQWLTQNHKTLFKIQNLCQNCRGQSSLYQLPFLLAPSQRGQLHSHLALWLKTP